MHKYYRSATQKWLAGVFGGLAEMLDIDPTLLRLTGIFVGLTTGIFPLLITYLVAWFAVPANVPVHT
jgi:phage shock protein C